LLSTHGMLKRITKIKIFDKDFPIQVSDTTQWLQSSYSLEVDNKIYIALNSDLFEYSNNKLVKVFTGPAPITSLSLVKKDDLWLGFLNKGATKISLKNYLVNPATPDLNGKTITRVLLDKEGGYWFSTIEKGVYYIPNFEIKTHPFRTQSRVKSAAVIGRTITIGDYSGRLINEDIYTGVAKWERNFESAIISVFAAQDSTIWVSTINGTYLITQQGLVKRKLYESSFINFAQSDSLGIWGFNSHGFHYFNKDGQLQRKKRLKEWYRNISVDPPDIYLGGRNGLFVYDTIFQFKNELSTFKNSKLSKVITLNDSLIAVATIGSGFYLWNKMTSQVNYSSLTNFKSESIYDLIKVDSSLWVATEHGVAIFNLNELQKGKSEYDFITNQYGLIGNRVIQLLNSKTAILALSDEGYSAIPIQHTKFINKKPRVYLKNFKVNGLSVSAHFPIKTKKSSKQYSI
jgi:ligand-binding sensor domain-containing protein